MSVVFFKQARPKFTDLCLLISLDTISPT